MSQTTQGTDPQHPERPGLGQRIYARLITVFGPATITPPDDDERRPAPR